MGTKWITERKKKSITENPVDEGRNSLFKQSANLLELFFSIIFYFRHLFRSLYIEQETKQKRRSLSIKDDETFSRFLFVSLNFKSFAYTLLSHMNTRPNDCKCKYYNKHLKIIRNKIKIKVKVKGLSSRNWGLVGETKARA